MAIIASDVKNPFTLDMNKILTGSPDPQILKQTFKDPKEIENLAFIMKDILQGDNGAARRDEYSYLNFKQISTALKWLQENGMSQELQQLILEKPYSLIFKIKPPTPEEFLGTKYIGSMNEFLWEPMKEEFCDFMNPMKPYRSGIWNTSIGSGKSTLTILVLLYIACCFALMRNPRKFFNFPDSAVFVFALCAVTATKASEIYIEPIQQLIESAPFWYKCKTDNEMKMEDKRLLEEDDIKYVSWRPAGRSSVITSSNGLAWKQISSAGSLLGMQILAGAMTEITFFLEAGRGWTNEKLMNFTAALRQRILNRFANNYYARFILDSSPSNLEDAVQDWITNEAKKNPENLVWTGARWNLYPWEFTDFINYNKETREKKEIHNFEKAFKLYKGGNGKPPMVIETEGEATLFEDSDTIWCPRTQYKTQGNTNYLNLAKENPIRFMQDFAGIPAGQADRLFYQSNWINDCFDNNLKNIYGSITALAQDEPEHLIWNQVQPLFFHTILNRNYFYYEPNLPRVISVDQSKSKDCTCIAMSHVERDPERIDEHTGQSIKVFVTDFTIVLVPKGGMINLDAIRYFIRDLRQLGGLNIKHVSFDGYQSEPTKQFLLRQGFTVDWVSVDMNNDPYFTFYDLVIHNRWFCGKNIFTKNNMKSLYQSRRKRTGTMKIDHFPGDLIYDYSGDWLVDQAGVNAKDTCDAITGNIELLGIYEQEFVPSKIWKKEEIYDRDYDTIKDKNTSILNKYKFV
jgi:hypothetical protein